MRLKDVISRDMSKKQIQPLRSSDSDRNGLQATLAILDVFIGNTLIGNKEKRNNFMGHSHEKPHKVVYITNGGELATESLTRSESKA